MLGFFSFFFDFVLLLTRSYVLFVVIVVNKLRCVYRHNMCVAKLKCTFTWPVYPDEPALTLPISFFSLLYSNDMSVLLNGFASSLRALGL